MTFDYEVTTKDENFFRTTVSVCWKMRSRLHSHQRGQRFLLFISKKHFPLTTGQVPVLPFDSFRPRNEQSEAIQNDSSDQGRQLRLFGGLPRQHP